MDKKLKHKILAKAREMYEKKETSIEVIEIHDTHAGEGRVLGRGIIHKNDGILETEIEITYSNVIKEEEIFVDISAIEKRYTR